MPHTFETILSKKSGFLPFFKIMSVGWVIIDGIMHNGFEVMLLMDMNEVDYPDQI